MTRDTFLSSRNNKIINKYSCHSKVVKKKKISIEKFKLLDDTFSLDEEKEEEGSCIHPSCIQNKESHPTPNFQAFLHSLPVRNFENRAHPSLLSREMEMRDFERRKRRRVFFMEGQEESGAQESRRDPAGSQWLLFARSNSVDRSDEPDWPCSNTSRSKPSSSSLTFLPTPLPILLLLFVIRRKRSVTIFRQDFFVALNSSSKKKKMYFFFFFWKHRGLKNLRIRFVALDEIFFERMSYRGFVDGKEFD